MYTPEEIEKITGLWQAFDNNNNEPIILLLPENNLRINGDNLTLLVKNKELISIINRYGVIVSTMSYNKIINILK